jgi:hypothetical protein
MKLTRDGQFNHALKRLNSLSGGQSDNTVSFEGSKSEFGQGLLSGKNILLCGQRLNAAQRGCAVEGGRRIDLLERRQLLLRGCKAGFALLMLQGKTLDFSPR